MRPHVSVSKAAASALLLSALAGGCKPAPAPPPVAGAPATGEISASAADARREVCRIRMTVPSPHQWISWSDPGDVALAGDSPSGAHSIYWASAQEKDHLRANRTAMPLDINCRSPGPPQIGLSLAAISSTEQEIPLGPGSYAIVGKSGGEVQPGQVLAGALLFDQHEYDATGGTLQIERFDMQGVSGSFSIDAVELLAGRKPIHIEGRFDMPCLGGMLETECKANKVKATVARDSDGREQ